MIFGQKLDTHSLCTLHDERFDVTKLILSLINIIEKLKSLCPQNDQRKRIALPKKFDAHFLSIFREENFGFFESKILPPNTIKNLESFRKD